MKVAGRIPKKGLNRRDLSSPLTRRGLNEGILSPTFPSPHTLKPLMASAVAPQSPHRGTGLAAPAQAAFLEPHVDISLTRIPPKKKCGELNNVGAVQNRLRGLRRTEIKKQATSTTMEQQFCLGLGLTI